MTFFLDDNLPMYTMENLLSSRPDPLCAELLMVLESKNFINFGIGWKLTVMLALQNNIILYRLVDSQHLSSVSY